MKFLHAILLCWFGFPLLLTAQQFEASYHTVSSIDPPSWIEIMYSPNPDLGAVVDAYRAYYQEHPFEKNQHTQYFKRWLRSEGRTLDPLWNTQDPVQRQKILDNRQAYLDKTTQLAIEKGPDSEWECLGPIDYDHDAAGRSYAPGAAHVYTVEQATSNPDILWAGTATAGVWKSEDYGLNWTLTTQDILVNGVRALEIDFSNPSVVYFGGGGTVYKTTDGGLSWNTTGDTDFNDINHSVNDMVMQPGNSNTLFFCANTGLYKTENAGTSWTQVRNGDWLELEFHPTNPNIVYAVKRIDNRTEFYKSSDTGNTWQLQPDGWPGVASSTSSTFTGLAYVGIPGSYTQFASNPEPGSGSFTDFTIELRVKSTGWEGDPAILSNKDWASGFNKGVVIAARDDGTGWKFNIGDGADRIDMDGGTINDGNWHHLVVSYDADGEKALYQDGNLIVSTNNTIPDSPASGLLMALAQDGTLGYGFDFPGSISEVRIWNVALSESTLSEWTCQPINNTHPNYASLQHYWPVDEGAGTTLNDNIGSNQGSIVGASSWEMNNLIHCIDYEFDAGEEQKRTEIAVSPDEPDAVFALATGAANGGSGLYGIYKSTDSGASWDFTCCGPEPSGPSSTVNPNIMGYNSQGTSDGGQYYYDVAFDVAKDDADNVQACGIMRWYSFDGGQSFTCPAGWSSPGNDAYIHADIHDLRFFQNGDIWVACDGGIYHSNDNGTTFNRRMQGIAGTDFWGYGSGFSDPYVMVGGTYHNSTLLKDNDVYINGWISTAIGGAGGDNVRGFVNPGKDRFLYMDAGKRWLPATGRKTSSIFLLHSK